MKHTRTRRSASRSQGGSDADDLNSAPSASQVPRALYKAHAQTRIERRILALPGVLVTTAGGFIATQLLVNTGQVNTATSFSALSSLFLEYRVVGLEVDFYPIVNAQTSLTTPAPSMLAIGKASSGTSPGTFEEIVQSPESKVVNALRPFRFVCSAKGFEDGMLWTAVGNAIPLSNQFGLTIGDSGLNPASAVSSTYFRWTAKFLTEWRSFA
jgi:hypothetical protein